MKLKHRKVTAALVSPTVAVMHSGYYRHEMQETNYIMFTATAMLGGKQISDICIAYLDSLSVTRKQLREHMSRIASFWWLTEAGNFLSADEKSANHWLDMAVEALWPLVRGYEEKRAASRANEQAYAQTGAAAVEAIAELVDEYGLPGIKYTPAEFAQIAITRGLIAESLREYAVAVAKQKIPLLSRAAF